MTLSHEARCEYGYSLLKLHAEMSSRLDVGQAPRILRKQISRDADEFHGRLSVCGTADFNMQKSGQMSGENGNSQPSKKTCHCTIISGSGKSDTPAASGGELSAFAKSIRLGGKVASRYSPRPLELGHPGGIAVSRGISCGRAGNRLHDRHWRGDRAGSLACADGTSTAHQGTIRKSVCYAAFHVRQPLFSQMFVSMQGGEFR